MIRPIANPDAVNHQRPRHARVFGGVQLYDRDRAEMCDQIAIRPNERPSWELPIPHARPRTAEVVFADGSRSVPTIIVDIDALLVRTLPPHRGKKRRIADLLAETTYEDLFLLQAINELETLDLAEQQGSESCPGAERNAGNGSEESPTTRIVSYEAFVQARSRARAEDRRQAALSSRRQDGSADLVSICLNRLIGLVAADLSAEDEADLRRQAEIDLRNTEPSSATDEGLNTEAAARPAEVKAARQRVRATAKKIHDAIVAFEERTTSLVGRRISTTELVRLRALLQVVLAHAQPANSNRGDLHVLPISGRGGDWPRLLGRLLNQHFKAMRALQALDVEADEGEQQRVLEYLAVARYAARAAVAGAGAAAPGNPILKPLEQLAKDVDAQVNAVLVLHADDIRAFGKINDRLNQRFAGSLLLPAVPRP